MSVDLFGKFYVEILLEGSSSLLVSSFSPSPHAIGVTLGGLELPDNGIN